MPDGLMGYNPGATATPPFVPQAPAAQPRLRPAGIGGGLFGGGVPYPVDPSMQQGLMRDAWRQFGLQLLANAQNPNIGQGLAAALASGRQAYAGGAEQAYQVGREQEQDAQYKQEQEALSEQRRQDAEKARRGAEEAASNRASALAAIENLPVSDEQKAAMRFRVQFGMGEPTESMLLPEEAEEPAAANWRAVPGVPGMVFNPADPTQTMRVASPPAKPAKPASAPAAGGPTPGQILTQIGQLIREGLSPEDAAAIVQRGVDEMTLQRGISAVEPPPVPARAADTGGQEQADPVVAQIEAIVNANPNLLKGVQTMLGRTPPATPQEILQKLESMGFGAE